LSTIQTPEFWVAVGFLLFVALVGKKGWAAITSALDTRADRIRDSLDKAALLREEAQHLLAEYQRKQREADKEVDDFLVAARAEAVRATAAAKETLDVTLKRYEQLTIDKIAQIEADALQTVHNTAVDLAILATQHLLTDKMNATTSAKLVDQAIAELPQKLH